VRKGLKKTPIFCSEAIYLFLELILRRLEVEDIVVVGSGLEVFGVQQRLVEVEDDRLKFWVI
jgi:hypothetical protein